MTQKFFCSTASFEEGEPLPGLGNPFARLLLVRAPRGEWRALRQRVLAGEGRFGNAAKAAIATGSRVVFIDRADSDDVPALLSYPDPTAVRTTDNKDAIEDMIVAWCRGAPLRGEPERRTTILCCTDGKTDPCCARFSMATFRALTAHADPAIFNLLQASHLGGCRFATTLITMPDHARYGRLVPDQVPAFLEALGAGQPYLPALRGIGRLGEAAQVATVGALRWAAERGLGAPPVSIGEDAPAIADAYAMAETDPSTCAIPLRVGDTELVAHLRRERFPALDACPSVEASFGRSPPRWVLEMLAPAGERSRSVA